MIFTLGREYAIPFSTICVGHRIFKLGYSIVRLERLLLDTKSIPPTPVNDNVQTHSKPRNSY